MAVRGKYTKAQQKMVDDTNKAADKMVGWAKSPTRMVASEESIKNVGLSADSWNPLWHDDSYAMNTRWGDIIAFPFFQERFGMSMFAPQSTPDCGIQDYIYIGDDWELFKPVRPGDTYKVWRKRPSMEDITSLDSKGPLRFRCVVADVCHINQNDELVSTFKRYMQCTFHSEPAEKVVYMPASRYRYTMAELEYINRIINEEEIHGANIRYWEDVNVGDKLKPVEFGPSTTATNQLPGGAPFIPAREMVKREPWMFFQDPDTGVYHSAIEAHQSDYAAQLLGYDGAFHFGPLARNLLARLVTNWMGDDGFIRRFKFRHMNRTHIGDTVIGRGKVVNKHVENGEHLVDLALWLESIRGYVTEPAVATVSLCSKEAAYPYKWK